MDAVPTDSVGSGGGSGGGKDCVFLVREMCESYFHPNTLPTNQRIRDRRALLYELNGYWSLDREWTVSQRERLFKMVCDDNIYLSSCLNPPRREQIPPGMNCIAILNTGTARRATMMMELIMLDEVQRRGIVDLAPLSSPILRHGGWSSDIEKDDEEPTPPPAYVKMRLEMATVLAYGLPNLHATAWARWRRHPRDARLLREDLHSWSIPDDAEIRRAADEFDNKSSEMITEGYWTAFKGTVINYYVQQKDIGLITAFRVWSKDGDDNKFRMAMLMTWFLYEEKCWRANKLPCSDYYKRILLRPSFRPKKKKFSEAPYYAFHNSNTLICLLLLSSNEPFSVVDEAVWLATQP